LSFRPKRVPTIGAAVAFTVLVGLGIWQVRRNGETQAMLREIEARIVEPPLGADGLGAPAADIAWRRVAVEGTFRDEVVRVPSAWVGPGHDVVSVLDTERGTAVLVDRGWVSVGTADDDVAKLLPPGPANVSGVVLDFRDATRTRGARYDWDALAARTGTGSFVVAEGEPRTSNAHSDTLPVNGWSRPHTSPHLEYAATWFTIAMVVAAFWVTASRGDAG
jgi:surfeit locus 1 family protein